MASLNSCCFAIDAKMESLALFNNSFGSQILRYQQKKPEKFGGFLEFVDHSKCNNRKPSFCKGRSVNGVRRRGLWRIKSVKGTASDSNEGEDRKDSDDAIQATLDKSKKVLAMQKELLQQIDERRKLVSSIKSTMTNPAEEPSAEDSDDSSPEISRGTNYKPGVVKEGKSIAGKGQPQAFSVTSSVGKKEPVKAPPRSVNVESSLGKQVRTREPEKTPTQFDITKGYHRREETSESQLHEKSTPAANSPRKADNFATLTDFLTKPYKASSMKDEKDQKLNESASNNLSSQVIGPVAEDAKPPPLAGPNVMNVILVAAECAQWVKTGGLGDVAGALPKALARRGHRVMVVVPRYGDYTEPQDTGVRKRYRVEGQDIEVGYFHTFIDGVDFVFIEAPMFRHLQANIYGGSRLDILKRMILFCKVAVEVPWHVPCGGVCYGDGNLVFIANDWHTALLPVYLKAYYRDNGIMTYTRSVLVIHNIAHQGRGPVDDFSYMDLPPHYIDYFKLYDPVGGEHGNIFAAGLKCADRIVTVSHGYAWEVKTLEGGWGLHNIINENDWKLRGIVNGIDTAEWSPQCDVHLTSDGYTNYSRETLRSGKAQCKEALQRELGLPVQANVPLIGFIGRLDHQKGVDLIAEAIPWLIEQGVQLVMLGTGRPDLEEMLRQVQNQHHDRIRGWVGFSVKTAHRITAGADILLMPSRFEPCGLNQLYAMNYGTIPVVHAVGGLRDTVQPFDPFSNTGLGWTFDRAEASSLIHALGNCLLTYHEYKESWEGLQVRGMSQDLSWDHAAQLYEEVLVAAKYQW